MYYVQTFCVLEQLFKNKYNFNTIKSQEGVQVMNIKKFEAAGKEATLYHSKESGSPLIILNNYAGDGKSVMEAAEKLERKDFNLLCVGNLNWDHDMTPWYLRQRCVKGIYW